MAHGLSLLEFGSFGICAADVARIDASHNARILRKEH